MLTAIPQLIIGVTDLAAAFLFMYGLKRMSSPVTAPSGIFVAGIGMLAAVVASFLYIFSVNAAAVPHLPVNVGLAVAALVVGGGAAWWSGRKVALTSMPQMVALYNGMGGGAAGAIAAVELFGNKAQGTTQLVVTLIGALIGAVSLSGSLIAWAKLDGVLKNPLRVKGQQLLNAVVMLATLAVGGYILYVAPSDAHSLVAMPTLIYVFFGCALVFGVLMTQIAIHSTHLCCLHVLMNVQLLGIERLEDRLSKEHFLRGTMRHEEETVGFQGLLIFEHAVLGDSKAEYRRPKYAEPSDYDGPFNCSEYHCSELAEHDDRPDQRNGHEDASEKQAPQATPHCAVSTPEPDAIIRVVEADDIFLRVIALADNAEMLDVEPSVSERTNSGFGSVVARENRDDCVISVHGVFFRVC
jgi:hypothetical protein